MRRASFRDERAIETPSIRGQARQSRGKWTETLAVRRRGSGPLVDGCGADIDPSPGSSGQGHRAWRLPKRSGPNSFRAAYVVLRSGEGQSSHSMMIKPRRLVSAEARAWSVLEHSVIPVTQSRFDSGLAYQRVQRTIAETRKDSADSSDRAE